MSSSLTEEITVPGRPVVQEVSDGIYAYIQPDVAPRGSTTPPAVSDSD